MFGPEGIFLVRLLVAAALGAAVGLERSIAGKHAGMRTYAMVSLGSCLFVIVGELSSLQLSFFSGLNPQQIAASVVIGIGFLGAGLASIKSEKHTGELTTASGIWLVAGIGMACGFGLYSVALASAIIAVGVFYLLLKVENKVRQRFGVAEQ
ncbi:MgtC/SapB family protein [Candidatus Parcubacteria bacterium]|nr:MgtC/SapB family protein [Candidatus Parcubacteria bacterium]